MFDLQTNKFKKKKKRKAERKTAIIIMRFDDEMDLVIVNDTGVYRTFSGLERSIREKKNSYDINAFTLFYLLVMVHFSRKKCNF